VHRSEISEGELQLDSIHQRADFGPGDIFDRSKFFYIGEVSAIQPVACPPFAFDWRRKLGRSMFSLQTLAWRGLGLPMGGDA
jgi:hypothetical protein